jgi:hypothetical protein
MRKTFVMVLAATLLLAGSAFASGRLFTQANASAGSGGAGFGQPGPFGGAALGGPSTTNNDDSCDISVAPAATLLLPYFNVSPVQGTQTTLFAVTNVSNLPQIAHVTVWTDWSYPVLDFNIFLTGYDVQTINLYDVIFRGVIAPPGTTSNGSATGPSPIGTRSALNTANANIAANQVGANQPCRQLVVNLPTILQAAVQAALTTGLYNPSSAGSVPSFNCDTVLVGGTHINAVGYVTIDVSSACSTTLPTTASYYTSEILFDNVLIGDYIDYNPSAAFNTAGGNPLVHIRAVPEGGSAGVAQVGTGLPYTFYDRYTTGAQGAASRAFDRRQPLPTAWAARYIENAGITFATTYKIWREGITNTANGCDFASSNSAMTIADIVRFDEHENPTANVTTGVIFSPPQGTNPVTLPETSQTSTGPNSPIYPPISTAAGDVGGWMYLNLNNGNTLGTYSSQRNLSGTPPAGSGQNTASTTAAPGEPTNGIRPSQNWVVISMGSGRFSVDFDAAWLGNGCSVAPGLNPVIGPTGGLVSVANPNANATP